MYDKALMSIIEIIEIKANLVYMQLLYVTACFMLHAIRLKKFQFK